MRVDDLIEELSKLPGHVDVAVGLVEVALMVNGKCVADESELFYDVDRVEARTFRGEPQVVVVFRG